jgi:hypothetical protein
MRDTETAGYILAIISCLLLLLVVLPLGLPAKVVVIAAFACAGVMMAAFVTLFIAS